MNSKREITRKPNPGCGTSSTADDRKILYLHTGFPKTGTTVLQEFFANNPDALASVGVCYVQAGRRRKDWKRGWIWPRRNMPDVATLRHLFQQHHSLFGPATEHSRMKFWDWSRSLALLSKEIRSSSFSKFLCSSELLNQGVKFSELPRLYEVFDCIKVVTYVRRQDGFASSLYEQSVKSNGFAGHLQYPIRKALTPDYANILSNWASLVKGRGELIVCPYEKQQFCGGNIYADFFHRVFDVDLDISQCKVPSGNPNPRLDRDALEFKRLLNICSDLQQGAVFLGGLLSYSEKREPETTLPFITRSLLSPDQKRELCLQFEESNAEVARGYLGREDGRLFYESLPALDTPWEVYSGLRREKMGEIIVFWKNERPELIELLDKVLKSIPNDAPEEDVSSLRMMQDMMK